MARKWLIARVTGVGSSDRQVNPRWLFDDEAAARAHATRLGRAAAMSVAMDRLETPWQGSDHEDWKASALVVLQGLDPEAVPGVKYDVCWVDEFVAPVEGPPANAREAWFRQARDAG